MSTTNSSNLNSFLKALEAVKGDFTCPICLDFLKNPVTFSKCFHMVCSDHYKGLKTCPECHISLDQCTAHFDDRIEISISSTKNLDQIFEKYKISENLQDKSTASSTKKRGRPKSSDKIEKVGKKLDSAIPVGTSTSSKAIKVEKENLVREKVMKENVQKKFSKETQSKSNLVEKFEPKIRSRNANVSFISNASSKFNKAIEKRNKKGETKLHIACRTGNLANVLEALNQEASTNTKDNAGWTPLHEVVQNNRLDLVKLLLQYNTLINVPGLDNETPLHEAVRFDFKDIAKELVINGADINARNCKGETPLQLANEDMKKVLIDASENVLQTQSVNITHISDMYSELDCEDIRVYCSSDSRAVIAKLKALAKYHGNLNIEAKLNKDTTHIIVDAENGVCASSLDVLHGIVNCLWILSSEWVTNSSEDQLQPFHQYEVTGVGNKTYNGPKNARYNKYKLYPGIFDGCHFYFHNFHAKYEVSKTIVLTKAVISKLVSDAGGVVLRRVPNPESIPEYEQLVPYHAKKDGKLVNCSHYIIYKDIYEPMYNMSHLKALPIGWLIECIEKYDLCEPW